MSETEIHYGRLEKIDFLPDETFEEACKRQVAQLGDNFRITEEPNYYESYEEYLTDNYSFINIKDSLFEIVEDISISEDDFIIEDIGNGVYEFFGSFYNGTTSLSEMLTNDIGRML